MVGQKLVMWGNDIYGDNLKERNLVTIYYDATFFSLHFENACMLCYNIEDYAITQ